MPNYKIASEEGKTKYGAEIGETVRLNLSKDEELAVTAAGWLEHVTVPKPPKEDK